MLQSKISDCFNIFSFEGENLVCKEHVVDMLRHLGIAISNNDGAALLDEIENDKIDINEFTEIVKKNEKHRITKEQLKKAFKTFDPEETGLVDIKILKDLLVSGEEKLNEEEVNEIVNLLCPNSEGMINYENFIKKCY